MRVLAHVGDVEAAVIQALRVGVGGGVSVATNVPRHADGTLRLPRELVRVSRSGGTRVSPAHDRPMVLVECYGPDGPTAWDLTGRTRAVMLALHDDLHAGLWLTHYSEISGPTNLPDPRTAWPRYQHMHQLTTRGSAQ